jgi:hypothetical protein
VPFEAEKQLFVDGLSRRVPGGPPAWNALLRRVRRGDHVVTPSLDRAFTSAVDCSAVLFLWGNLGIELHAVDLGGPLHRLDVPAVARAIADLEQAARSEKAAESAAHSRYSGRPVNGCSPYGFAWVRRRGGEWGLTPDEAERALMKRLLAWHEAGHSIDQIRQHLQYGVKLEFYKQRGRRKRLVRWNSDAIWRRIQAERRLMELKA